MSDDYTPDDISAEELLSMWAKRYGSKYENGLVPIHWSFPARRSPLSRGCRSVQPPSGARP